MLDVTDGVIVGVTVVDTTIGNNGVLLFVTVGVFVAVAVFVGVIVGVTVDV